MTPEQAYEALLRNGGRRVNDQGYTGHPYHWYFDPGTGLLCLACQCGFKSDFPQFARPAPDEPDHDLAFDLPPWDYPAYDPEMADEKDEIEYAPLIADSPAHVDPGEAE